MQNDIYCICSCEAVIVIAHLVAAALQFHLCLHVVDHFIPYLCGSEWAWLQKSNVQHNYKKFIGNPLIFK